MTPQEKLQAVREEIIKAVPDVFVEGCESAEKNCNNCWWHRTYPPDGNKYRPIRLADVLLALNDESQDVHGLVVNTGGQMAILKHGESWKVSRLTDVVQWDLRQDDLSLQSPETINFLHQLLCG